MNGPNPKRRLAMSKTQNPTVTLYGNVGQDPVTHQTKEKPATGCRYSPVTDSVESFDYTVPSKTFRTFQIAIKNPEDDDNPRWISCIDWTDQTSLFRKGDRVRLHGYFKLRTYTDRNEEEQRVNQFVIKSAGIERAKIRRPTRETQEEVEDQAIQLDAPAQELEEEEIPF
jgi:single-stranded DNA-binding protein